MARPTVIEVGPVTLTRVLYVDAVIPPEPVGFTADEVVGLRATHEWCDDTLSTAEGQVRVGAAAWVASAGGEHAVIDPFGNADDIFHDAEHAGSHQAAMAVAFDAVGIPIDSITRVVSSHFEGIGMNGVRRDGRWVPFFPNARITVGEAALARFGDLPDHWTTDAWRELIDGGCVETYADGDEVLPGVRAQHTGAHNPGHSVFHVGDAATYVGHLAVTPLHLGSGPCVPQHVDPDLAWDLLQAFAADGRIVLGPLWPSPGAGRWVDGAFVPEEG